MNIEVISKKKNEIIPREEIILLITHTGKPQPKRYELKTNASIKLGLKEDTVNIIKIQPLFGQSESKATLHVYKNKEGLEKYEPSYLKNRNKKPEVKKEEQTPSEPVKSEEKVEKKEEQKEATKIKEKTDGKESVKTEEKKGEKVNG